MHIACRHQSVLASNNLVKISIKESNNRDGGRQRDQEVLDLLEINGETSFQAKPERKYITEQYLKKPCDLTVTHMTLLLLSYTRGSHFRDVHTGVGYMSLANMKVNHQHKMIGFAKKI